MRWEKVTLQHLVCGTFRRSQAIAHEGLAAQMTSRLR